MNNPHQKARTTRLARAEAISSAFMVVSAGEHLLRLSREQPDQKSHLEHLTKPVALIEADECPSECCEGQVDVHMVFIANGEAAKAAEPCQCALDDPSIPSSPLAGALSA
jgi:hypothetical protein